MFREEPSASIIFGFSTQILSSLILNSSMLCGMIVGIISRFSSIIVLSSFSMKLLKEAISESTKLCSSKYFCMSVLPYLYISYHPVKMRFSGCRAFSYDFDDIARLWLQLFYSGVCLEYLGHLFRSYSVLFKKLRLVLFANLNVLRSQYVLINFEFWLFHVVIFSYILFLGNSGPDEIRTRDHLIKSFTRPCVHLPKSAGALLPKLRYMPAVRRLALGAITRLSYRPINIKYALVGTFIELLIFKRLF